MAVAAAIQHSYALHGYASGDGFSAMSTLKTTHAARFRRKFGASFATGSPLVFKRCYYQRSHIFNPKSVSAIKCQQGTGLAVWLGRLSMVGFAAVITVEFSTGKGLLESIGLTAPLPTVALAVTAFVGALTALFIFQSSSDI